MSDAREPLSIDVVSDVVCPWCYLGEKRLAAALAEEAGPVVVRWRPYQLDPTIPEGGLDRAEYMERKFGRDGRLKAVHDQLVALGAEVGLAFAFDKIARAPNTLDAHRLIRWAASSGRAGRRWSTGCFAPISSRGATSATARCCSTSPRSAASTRRSSARLLDEGADVEAVRERDCPGAGDRRHRRAVLHFRRTARRAGRAGRRGAATGDRRSADGEGPSRRPEPSGRVERQNEIGGKLDGRGEIVRPGRQRRAQDRTSASSAAGSSLAGAKSRLGGRTLAWIAARVVRGFRARGFARRTARGAPGTAQAPDRAPLRRPR